MNKFGALKFYLFEVELIIFLIFYVERVQSFSELSEIVLIDLFCNLPDLDKYVWYAFLQHAMLP